MLLPVGGVPILYPLPDPIGDDVTLPVECPPPGGFVPPWMQWCDHGYLGAGLGCFMLEQGV